MGKFVRVVLDEPNHYYVAVVYVEDSLFSLCKQMSSWYRNKKVNKTGVTSKYADIIYSKWRVIL